MADVDEDAFPQGGGSAEDNDLDDETQDFRFLATLSRENASIPKRGEKDFEPHATALQSNTLTASRQAMHNALAFQRAHPPRNHILAVYHPESNTSYVDSPKGIHFARMGFSIPARDDPVGTGELHPQRLWLLPEETLYLLERGALDVHWPAYEGEDVADDAEREGLPMSLQGAYAVMIGDGEAPTASLTLEKFSVYAALKRAGYTVQRATTWSSSGLSLTDANFAPRPPRTWDVGLYDNARWWYFLLSNSEAMPPAEQEIGPLVTRKSYRNYEDIYRRLALINFHDPAAIHETAEYSDTPRPDDLRITYHVWKPGSSTFKKSAPGIPDFRIAVINARETNIPTLEQLDALLETTPYDPPTPTIPLYQKLKHGYKNVLLAVVDQGIISYLRIADAAFGREKLYERHDRGPSGKRGRPNGRGRRGR